MNDGSTLVGSRAQAQTSTSASRGSQSRGTQSRGTQSRGTQSRGTQSTAGGGDEATGRAGQSPSSSSAERRGTESESAAKSAAETATKSASESVESVDSVESVESAAHLAPEVLEKLRAAGLSEEQLALVLSLAEAELLPLLLELAELRECESERNKLVRHFGGEESWQRVGEDLLRWGRSALAADLFTALASSAEGVKAMAQLRESGSEPSLIEGSGSSTGGEDETSLRRLMSDPSYWRRRDPALASRVREGFRRIYPS
ncbi:MAG: hypothetical protein OD811_05825 [Alphaproteobacteria bacterium]